MIVAKGSWSVDVVVVVIPLLLSWDLVTVNHLLLITLLLFLHLREWRAIVLLLIAEEKKSTPRIPCEIPE
jgi:hypothetical protein